MSGLTKQHFNKIAEMVRKYLADDRESDSYEETEKYYISDGWGFICDLSNYFKTQNPLFNENQFKKACLE